MTVSLSPRAAADMLRRHGAGKDGMVVATVLLAASTARWRARHDGWDGETERRLALEALQPNDVAFERAAKRAAEIVARHWSEITTES